VLCGSFAPFAVKDFDRTSSSLQTFTIPAHNQFLPPRVLTNAERMVPQRIGPSGIRISTALRKASQ
jgi:hypothetical protein